MPVILLPYGLIFVSVWGVRYSRHLCTVDIKRMSGIHALLLFFSTCGIHAANPTSPRFPVGARRKTGRAAVPGRAVPVKVAEYRTCFFQTKTRNKIGSPGRREQARRQSFRSPRPAESWTSLRLVQRADYRPRTGNKATSAMFSLVPREKPTPKKVVPGEIQKRKEGVCFANPLGLLLLKELIG
jgi:hypothetical protein